MIKQTREPLSDNVIALIPDYLKQEVERLFSIFIWDFHSDKVKDRFSPYRETVRHISNERLSTLIKDTA
jgi:hypothetical protein